MAGYRYVGIAFLMLALFAGVSYAYGYGTSSITLSTYSITLINGGTARVNYNVSLVSGSMWGTTLNIADSRYLLSKGIEVSFNQGFPRDPPFSGNISIVVSPSAPKGSYQVIINATGDDPSVSNATLTLTVASPNSTSTTAMPSNLTKTTSAPTVQTTIAPTTAPYKQQKGYAVSALVAELLAGIILPLIAAIVLTFVFKGAPTRLAIWGIALIIIGTVLWLYGDYSGFNLAYVWSGVAALVIGTIVWIAGDVKAGAYRNVELPAFLDIIGIVLIVVGILVWLYGDFYASGNLTYIWSGVAVIAIGTVLWIIGNAISGTFRRAHATSHGR